MISSFLLNKKKLCNGCSACFNICPKSCINMQEDAEGFVYPVVDSDKCINCNRCIEICPVINKHYYSNDCSAYGAYNIDKDIQKASSSGGIFYLLAEHVIEKKGMVWGAMFDSAFNVIHGCVDDINSISKLMGSKYVQSNIGNSYNIIKKQLEEKLYVLFVGTPCQVAGLKHFLGADYKSLYTVDLVCHGVPSPLVWRKYVQERNGCSIANIAFRDKSISWRTYCLKFEYNDHTSAKETLINDVFLQGFLQDLYLRPSCYKCEFKTLSRYSDLTLADFWGIENIYPDMDDNTGVSFIILQSDKGKNLFKAMKHKVVSRSVIINDVLQYNTSLVQSSKPNQLRKFFFNELNVENTVNISALIKKYTKPDIQLKIYRAIANRVYRMKTYVLKRIERGNA